MKILAIETSSRNFSLAISDDAEIIKTRTMVLDKILSDSIIPAIGKILKDSKLSLAKINAIVVGLGPGSFTSLRVGLSTVKGLAFAANKPLLGIVSLDAVALNIGKTSSQIWVIADAKRNMVYGACYENKKGVLKRKSEYLLTPLINLLDRISINTVFVGDAVAVYRTTIESYFSNKGSQLEINFATESQSFPSAENLILLAQDKLHKKKFASIDKIVPLYLYPEDCQVQQ